MNGNADAILTTGAATGLNATGDDITIGNSGTISGRAVIGSASGMAVTDSFDVIASVLGSDGNGNAQATASDIDAIGITGGTLTAGPSGGNILGEAVAGINVLASTVNGDPGTGTTGNSSAEATLSNGTVIGITDATLIGGQSGTNLISGRATGAFTTTATSVAGNSTANGDADAFGITGGTSADTITLSGNVQAIAQLSNTVTATSVSGNAVATATSDAVGLNNYNVTIISGGNVTGRADALSRAVASDTAGSASARAIL